MIRPSWREEFIAWWAFTVTRGGTTQAFGPMSLADTAVALMADARTVRRVAETECNRELTRRAALRSARAAGRIVVVVDQHLPGWHVEVGGGPRGCVVNLYAPGVDPESGTGIGVPSR